MRLKHEHTLKNELAWLFQNTTEAWQCHSKDIPRALRNPLKVRITQYKMNKSCLHAGYGVLSVITFTILDSVKHLFTLTVYIAMSVVHNSEKRQIYIFNNYRGFNLHQMLLSKPYWILDPILYLW